MKYRKNYDPSSVYRMGPSAIATINHCINNTRNGIVLINSNNGILENNSCSWNRLSGVKIRYSKNNSISNNKCNNNLKFGIFLDKYSNQNIVKNNICIDNGEANLHIEKNDSVSIQYNLLVFIFVLTLIFNFSLIGILFSKKYNKIKLKTYFISWFGIWAFTDLAMTYLMDKDLVNEKNPAVSIFNLGWPGLILNTVIFFFLCSILYVKFFSDETLLKEIKNDFNLLKNHISFPIQSRWTKGHSYKKRKSILTSDEKKKLWIISFLLPMSLTIGTIIILYANFITHYSIFELRILNSFIFIILVSIISFILSFIILIFFATRKDVGS